ncbi:MAG: aldehyde dehydrogenase family protein [Chloroflexi bacterium]|nr:aldehyde dehydrogenase family protein [Chloroflexota bacterium]
MKPLLDSLGIQAVNPGACVGPEGWTTDKGGRELISYNPTTNEPIASVIQATPAVYEKVVGAAQEAFKSWRAHSHFHACRNRVMKPKERGENWPIGRSFSNARL